MNNGAARYSLIKKTGKCSAHWEVQSLNPRTEAMYGNRGFPGVRTYNTLAEVKAHCKAFRGISALIGQP